MLSRMLVPMALVLFFASPLIAAVPPGEPSSASLLARPVDMRREDHAKRASPWGNEPPFNIVFDDLELTKTDQHMRIFKIHCGYWLEDGITYLAFDYKNMHDITGSEVHSVEHSREAHGYPGDGTVTHVELVRGDFIHKVVVHRSPTINGGNFRINYMEFWTANGDRQHKALYTCGVADPKVNRGDIHVHTGLVNNPPLAVLNFVGAFGPYRRPSLRTIGLDWIPVEDF